MLWSPGKETLAPFEFAGAANPKDVMGLTSL
jgi:hypothetical protein